MSDSFGASATVITAVSAASAASLTPALAVFGIDGASIGAGLLGCIAVQIFMPPEKITLKAAGLTAVGSVIVATLGAPFVTPTLISLAPNAVTPDHAHAAASALLGGFAKPFLKLLYDRFLKGRFPKGTEDAAS